MTFELLDTEAEDNSEEAVQEVERWANHISEYITGDEDVKQKVLKRFADRPSFLARYVVEYLCVLSFLNQLGYLNFIVLYKKIKNLNESLIDVVRLGGRGN